LLQRTYSGNVTVVQTNLGLTIMTAARALIQPHGAVEGEFAPRTER
jgi:hypothetical protein